MIWFPAVLSEYHRRCPSQPPGPRKHERPTPQMKDGAVQRQLKGVSPITKRSLYGFRFSFLCASNMEVFPLCVSWWM